MSLPVCELKPGRDKSIRRKHPWIFSGAVAYEPDEEPGALVDVYSAEGDFLGRGAYNPFSQIRVRVFTFEDEDIDENFFVKRLTEAKHYRQAFLPEDTTCYRACFSEGDRLPGLIVDYYNGFIVIQFQTAAVDAQKELIVSAVEKVFKPEGVWERSDSGFRQDEGLESSSGLLAGSEPPEYVEVTENGIKMLVDLRHGQKTGMFLDQRQSRRLVKSLAEGRTILNTFSYAGAFALAGLAGKAKSVINVDNSADALRLAEKNYDLNQCEVSEDSFVKMDAFEYLRNTDSKFDLVICDPPAFCKSQAGIPKAMRGYKEIIMRGLHRLNPDGLLLCFSCSGHIDRSMFQKVVFSAAIDAGKDIQILKTIGHDFDHPINIYHPEGEYLCGFLVHLSETVAGF